MADNKKKTEYKDESQVVLDTLRLFYQLQTWRAVFAGHWEETAELIYPEMRNTFFQGSFNWPGQKKTDRQVDATGMLALQRFAAICDSLLTPANNQWHALTTNNPVLNRSRRVRLWFEQATNLLFAHRYSPASGFQGQNHANYLSLGAFGNMGMFVDELSDPIYHRRGLRYRSIPMGELHFYANHQNVVCGFIRYFRMTAYQCLTMFGRENLPEVLEAPLESNSQMLYDFLHHVCMNEDFEPGRIGPKGKPWYSVYISIPGRCVLQEGGYRSFPLSVGRYIQGPQEVYGRGPAQMVLPSLKTLNLEKRVYLQQGHRAAAPVLLINDDGLIDSVDLRPGAINKGGVNAQGQPLVHVLPTGDIQVSKEMMDEERTLINDAFLVTLFQILTETPQMTATEVIERTNEKGILLAPTIGRQQGEYLGTLIDRELDILAYNKLLPPMPPELVEAKGEYAVEYTSPLSKAMKAQEAAGFMRTLESALTVANATQDPSILDVFDFDVAIPAIADIQAVPESWMADMKKIAQRRQARAEAQQRQEQIQAAPAQAGLLSAQAKMAAAQAKGGGAPGGMPAVNQPGVGGGALQPAPQGQPSFGGPAQ